ncbi:MAG: fumarylacetoacetate hydrolase family protein [Burkholderiaceae bacterium]
MRADDASIAQALMRSRRTGQSLDAEAFKVADAAQAYRVQALVADGMGWFDEGVPRFWKSGGPGREAALTHAPLPPSGIHQSVFQRVSENPDWLGVEAEMALRIGQDVDGRMAQALSEEQALALVDAMAVSIELVASRWHQGMLAPPWHKLADQQSHGALVLGEWQAMRAVDWSRQGCQVIIGAQTRTFVGTHSLRDPTWLLTRWLRHATASGDVLAAGSVVTTGTWCGLLAVRAGDAVQVRFDGIGHAQALL